jgi:hypothetical protein
MPMDRKCAPGVTSVVPTFGGTTEIIKEIIGRSLGL